MPAYHRIDPSKLPERLERLPGIAQLRAAAAGVPAYLVGGAVRDLLPAARRAPTSTSPSRATSVRSPTRSAAS